MHPSLLLLLPLVTGCASGNISTADFDKALAEYADAAGSGSEVHKPRDGDWTYRSVEILSDTCANAVDMVKLADGFTTSREGLIFDMNLGGGTSARCGVDQTSFDCTPLVDTEDPDASVSMETTWETYGLLHSPDDMEGVHELTISCDGGGCKLIEAAKGVRFPCRFGAFFTADTR
jgi:hypothetical protein